MSSTTIPKSRSPLPEGVAQVGVHQLNGLRDEDYPLHSGAAQSSPGSMSWVEEMGKEKTVNYLQYDCNSRVKIFHDYVSPNMRTQSSPDVNPRVIKWDQHAILQQLWFC